MRLIKFDAPDGKGDAVTKVVVAVEIDKVSRRRIESHRRAGGTELLKFHHAARRDIYCLFIEQRVEPKNIQTE